MMLLQLRILKPIMLVFVKVDSLHCQLNLPVNSFVIKHATTFQQLTTQQPIIAVVRQATQGCHLLTAQRGDVRLLVIRLQQRILLPLMIVHVKLVTLR